MVDYPQARVVIGPKSHTLILILKAESIQRYASEPRTYEYPPEVRTRGVTWTPKKVKVQDIDNWLEPSNFQWPALLGSMSKTKSLEVEITRLRISTAGTVTLGVSQCLGSNFYSSLGTILPVFSAQSLGVEISYTTTPEMIPKLLQFDKDV